MNKKKLEQTARTSGEKHVQKSKERYLVVTSDQNLWPKNEQILALGKWCFTNNGRIHPADQNVKVAEPFSAGISKHLAEVSRLQILEERILFRLSTVLNQFHNKSYSSRQWKIILGHWLRRYITLIFNRYYTLHNCLAKHDIDKVIFYPNDSYCLVTRTSNEFVMACNDKTWNSALWHRIWIKSDVGKDKIIFSASPKEFCFQVASDPTDSKLKRCVSKISSILNRNSKLMFISTYLPRKTQLMMNVRSFSFPQIWPKNRKTLKSPTDQKVRERLRECFSGFSTNKFEVICIELLFDLIPICFVEGFGEVEKNVKDIGFPRNPSVMFTSNNFDTDEEFKIWVAEKISSGSKYVIGQHGSSYGVNIVESPFIEETIADAFVTWGKHQPYPNNKSGFIFTYPKLGMLSSKTGGKITLVQLAPPFHLYHYDAHHDYDCYFNELISFYNALPQHIQQNIVIRLPGLSAKSGSSDIDRWRSAAPQISIDNFSQPFAKAVSKSRLMIFTYYSTGVLECMSQNIPIVCFWKNPLEIVRPEVKHLFERLINAGILHETSDQAAIHLLSINRDIEAWWNSNDVKACRDEFTDQFAKHSQNPDKDLLALLWCVKGD